MLAVVHVLGSMLMLFSVTYLLPIGDVGHLRGRAARRLRVAALICLGVGGLLWFATRRNKRELRSRDGFLLVSLGWALMSAIATVPLLMALPGLSFTDAFFETMSGLSTTGATVLVGLDDLPPSINLWRHALCWFGGMGIIVLVVAILPLLGVGGMQLYKAETPGPVKNEKLTPRITQTAKALWFIYFLITMACIVSLKLAGMDWFDAVCHAFATMALGGFSTHDASVGYFDSVADRDRADRLHADRGHEFQPALHRLAAEEPAHVCDRRRGEGDARDHRAQHAGTRAFHLVPRHLRRASGRRCGTSHSISCRSRRTADS